MSAEKPDVSKIAALCRKIVDEDNAPHEAAVDALLHIAKNMRSQFGASDDELEPIAHLISQLNGSARKVANG